MSRSRWPRCGGLALPEVDEAAALADPALPLEGGAVLVADQLEGGGSATLGDERRPGEEDLPQPEPALAVGVHHRVAVAQPVAVPALDGERVVDADVLHAVDLEARALEIVAHEAERH